MGHSAMKRYTDDHESDNGSSSSDDDERQRRTAAAARPVFVRSIATSSSSTTSSTTTTTSTSTTTTSKATSKTKIVGSNATRMIGFDIGVKAREKRRQVAVELLDDQLEHGTKQEMNDSSTKSFLDNVDDSDDDDDDAAYAAWEARERARIARDRKERELLGIGKTSHGVRGSLHDAVEAEDVSENAHRDNST